MNQPYLWDSPIEPVIEPLEVADYDGTLSERFDAFHRANPAVYASLKQIALDLVRRGIKRSSIAFCFERLRWLYAIQTSGDVFKLNNNYKPYYARLLMESVPELVGFFELRGGRHQEEE